MTSTVNLLGLIQGWKFQEKKGSAFYNLFHQLRFQGNMSEVVDFELPFLVRKACFLKNISASKDIWKIKDQLDVYRYKIASKYAINAVEEVCEDYNSVIQIGSNYSISDSESVRKRDVPLFSFHDNNLSSYAKSIPLALRPKEVVSRAYDFEKGVYDSLTRVFTMSKTLRKSFIEDFQLPEEKVVYAGFGSIFPVRDVSKKSYDTRNILFVASHSFKAKGGQDLVKAFKIARKSYPSLTLTLVGKDWGINEPGVSCYGFLDKRNPIDLEIYQKCFEDASIFVLPSYNEAFGEVFIEAMSYGIPCIGTSCGVMPEIIEGNNAGYVVNRGDIESLGRLICDLLSSENELKRLGASGARAVQSEYQWSTVIRRICSEVAAFI
ncbi:MULTISPECIES: glycosyltransferase family 4 protein [Marinobacter]|jgi:glycosyltransferase involved in cell wall biosynthesis|uniref:Glycosyltransferase n=3 Tax=Marinobacter TaxID=2742 RepID=A0A137SH62_9GAMM|nr:MULTISPECIES: glycosyltransferase family 4 protein [Marinobacter]KXO11769.1 Glycosyltransferase [Marinobacter excellens LAMA 842]